MPAMHAEERKTDRAPFSPSDSHGMNLRIKCRNRPAFEGDTVIYIVEEIEDHDERP